MYNNLISWKEAYEKSGLNKTINNEATFWNIYNGFSYKLVKPEVFTKENKHIHSGYSKSGELNGRAKLKKEDVIEIRRLHE